MNAKKSLFLLAMLTLCLLANTSRARVQAISRTYGGGGGGGGISLTSPTASGGCREFPVPCAENVDAASTLYGIYEQTCNATFLACTYSDHDYLVGGSGVIKSLSSNSPATPTNNVTVSSPSNAVTQSQHLIGDVYLELTGSKQELEALQNKYTTNALGNTQLKDGELVTRDEANLLAQNTIHAYDTMIEFVEYFEQEGANIKMNEIFSPEMIESLQFNYSISSELDQLKEMYAENNINFDIDNLGEMKFSDLMMLGAENQLTSADIARIRTDAITNGAYAHYAGNEDEIDEAGMQALLSETLLAINNFNPITTAIENILYESTHLYGAGNEWKAMTQEITSNLREGDISAITPAYDGQTPNQLAARAILDSTSTRVTQQEIDDFYAGTGTGLNANPNGASTPGTGWSGRTESQQWAHDVVASWNASQSNNNRGSSGGGGGGGDGGGGGGSGSRGSSGGGGSYNDTGNPGNTGAGSPSEGASREGR